jgi:uncharacterized protein YebE (UPF0316 family)
MARHSFWTEFFLVNLIYVVMYTFTLGFIYPIQKILAAESVAVVGLFVYPPRRTRCCISLSWVASNFSIVACLLFDLGHNCVWKRS